MTTSTAPAGNPAAATRSANRSAVSGVSSAGLTTAVFPAARAGATLRQSIDSGAFHGTMCALTPTGSGTVYASVPGPSGMVSPCRAVAAPA